MSANLPDFSVIEQTIERRLRQLGLSPHTGEKYVDTGYKIFEIHRFETQVLTLASKDDLTNLQSHDLIFASAEILAKMEHHSFGSAEIADLIVFKGTNATELLEQCANTYMDVTFPALQSLFEGKPAAGTQGLKLSTITGSTGKPLGWEVFTGQLQILNDDGWLAERLNQPPIALLLHTLTGFLARPTLHWCKIFGKAAGEGKVEFGCSIDGRKSPEAEAEMLSKFGVLDQVRRNWEFRQFIVMRPTGHVDEDVAQRLREEQKKF